MEKIKVNKETLDSIRQYLLVNKEFIEENFDMDTIDEHEATAYFLLNLHNKLSIISESTCDLTSSAHIASVYIEHIEDFQRKENNRVIQEAVNKILATGSDKLVEIKTFIDNLEI